MKLYLLSVTSEANSLRGSTGSEGEHIRLVKALCGMQYPELRSCYTRGGSDAWQKGHHEKTGHLRTQIPQQQHSPRGEADRAMQKNEATVS